MTEGRSSGTSTSQEHSGSQPGKARAQVLFEVVEHGDDLDRLECDVAPDQLEAAAHALEPLEVTLDVVRDFAGVHLSGSLVAGKSQHLHPALEGGQGRTQLMGQLARHRCPGPLGIRETLGSNHGEPEQDRQKESPRQKPGNVEQTGGLRRITEVQMVPGRRTDRRVDRVENAKVVPYLALPLHGLQIGFEREVDRGEHGVTRTRPDHGYVALEDDALELPEGFVGGERVGIVDGGQHLGVDPGDSRRRCP